MVAGLADHRAAGDRDVGADQRARADHGVVVEHRVRQDADVVLDHDVAGDHDARHDQHVAPDLRQRRNARARVDDPRETIGGDAEAVDQRAAAEVRRRAAGHGEHRCLGALAQHEARVDAHAVTLASLLAGRVVDEADAAVRVAQAAERLDGVPVAGKDEQRPRGSTSHRVSGSRRARGRHRAGSDARVSSATAPATSATWADVSSGNIGSDSVSFAAFSECGNDPGLCPRSANAGRRCTGVG